MFLAMAVTMLSIMKPVLGTPTGTGVLPVGAMATQTPSAKTLGKVGLRWCLSTMMKPRGLVRPSMPRTAATPRKAGSIIEKAKGRSCVALTEPSSAISSTCITPASTEATLALVIHLMCRSRISLSSRPLVSPTPSRPRWPM